MFFSTVKYNYQIWWKCNYLKWLNIVVIKITGYLKYNFQLYVIENNKVVHSVLWKKTVFVRRIYLEILWNNFTVMELVTLVMLNNCYVKRMMRMIRTYSKVHHSIINRFSFLYFANRYNFLSIEIDIKPFLLWIVE